jgi:hypothetical protein
MSVGRNGQFMESVRTENFRRAQAHAR